MIALALLLFDLPLLLLFWPQRRRAQFVQNDAPPWLRLAGWLLIAIVAALFVEHSLRYPDGNWDARAIWNLRARSIYGAPSDFGAIFSPDVQHPDYPPLLPALVAHLWFLSGRTQVVPVLVSAAFAISGALVLYKGVARQAGTGAAWCALLLLVGAPIFLQQTWGQAADLKVAVLLLLAVVAAREERFLYAGFAAGLAALTKNEGAFEALLLLLLLRNRRSLLGASMPLALFALFHLAVPANDLQAALHWPHALPLRLLHVLRAFVAQLWNFAEWGLALPSVILLALWKRPPLHFAGLALLLFLGIYLFTPLPLEYHLDSSLDRLLFQLFPSSLYATLGYSVRDG